MVTCIPLTINESPDQHIRVIDQPVKIMHPLLTVTFNNEGNTLFQLVVCIKVRLIGLHPPPHPCGHGHFVILPCHDIKGEVHSIQSHSKF